MKKEIIGQVPGKNQQLTIAAKDFANELTSYNVIEKDLNKQAQMSREHVDINKAVRDILLQRGVRPEALPPAEDVKKLERRLDGYPKKGCERGRLKTKV